MNVPPPSLGLGRRPLGLVVLLAAGCAENPSPELEAAKGLAARGRAALRQGRGAEAVEALSRSATLRLREGQKEEATQDLQAAAFAALRIQMDPRGARSLLLRARSSAPPGGELEALQPYYDGLVSAMSARHVEAVRSFRRARLRLLELGLSDRALGVDEVSASSLLHLARWTEARNALDRLRSATPRSSCSDARRLGNLGWLELELAEAEGQPAASTTVQTLRSARAIYETDQCGPIPAALIHNLAYALLLTGETERAAETLREPHAAPQGEERWFRAELLSRIAAARGHSAKARGLLGAALRNRPIPPVDAQYRLFLLRARLFAADEAFDAALADFENADRLLDDLVHRVPLGEGRTALVRAQSPHLADWLALLLERGRFEDAECAARRARARTLAAAARSLRLGSLDAETEARWVAAIAAFRRERERELELAKEGWQVPSDQLATHQAQVAEHAGRARNALERALRILEGEHAPLTCADLPKPDPGSLFLTFAPLPAGGVLFARDINGVSSHRKEGRQPFAEWPHQVGSALKGANRVRVVVVDGATRNPHVAPWRGRPLLLQRTVVFGLDLPSSFPEPRAPDRQALIVSDPQENLPGARHELSTVAPLLKARGYDVRALKGAEAELQTVHEALRASTHFHYAGHAEDAADAPAHDGLRLDGGTLSPGDVLALDTAPASVVLMGCQTLGENNGSGLGVAQSFLLAGAKWVLASGRNVDDQLAPRLSEALYASPERDLDDAFARAARILHVEGDAGWRAFQVWVR